MLKVLLLLDCDDCGHPLSQATACSVSDPMVWQAAGWDLVEEAQKIGWDFHKNHIRCSECNYPAQS
jgi:hypothetical protein